MYFVMKSTQNNGANFENEKKGIDEKLFSHFKRSHKMHSNCYNEHENSNKT